MAKGVKIFRAKILLTGRGVLWYDGCVGNIPRLKVGELYFIQGKHEFIKHIGLVRFYIEVGTRIQIEFILYNSIVMVLGVGWAIDEKVMIKVLHQDKVGYISLETDFVHCKTGELIDPVRNAVSWSDLPIDVEEFNRRNSKR